MRVSELTAAVARDYMRIDGTADDALVELCLNAARQYAVTYTGRPLDELDGMPDVVLAVLIIANEFYSNRDYTGTVTSVNPLVAQVLGSKSCNLL